MGLGGLLLVAALGIALRIFIGIMNHSSIRDYFRNRGGEVENISWQPSLGNGPAHYNVRYSDGDGNIHEIMCTAGFFSGVYTSDDRIVQYAHNPELADRSVTFLLPAEAEHEAPVAAPSPDAKPVIQNEYGRRKVENRLLREKIARLREIRDDDGLS